MSSHRCARGIHPEPVNACSAVCGCRCDGCRAVHTAYEANRRRQIAYGRWEPFVDAADVVAHLRAVMAPPPGALEGVGRRTIAQQTGVGETTIQELLGGVRHKVTKENADRLLTFDGRPVGAARMPARTSAKRLDELVDAGFTPTELARYLTGRVNAISTVVTAIRTGRYVTADRAAAVEALHARWVAGEIVPRGRWSPHQYGPQSPFPATPAPVTCESCTSPPADGGRWCWPCFSKRATPKTTGCGTAAGYARHRRAGTTPCPRCRQANALDKQLRVERSRRTA